MKKNDMLWDMKGRLVLGSETVENSDILNIIKDVCSDDDTQFDSRHSKDFFKILLLTKFDPCYGAVDK